MKQRLLILLLYIPCSLSAMNNPNATSMEIDDRDGYDITCEISERSPHSGKHKITAFQRFHLLFQQHLRENVELKEFIQRHSSVGQSSSPPLPYIEPDEKNN